jgi:uncharacterized cupredoxin-like copper-binding protein
VLFAHFKSLVLLVGIILVLTTCGAGQPTSGSSQGAEAPAPAQRVEVIGKEFSFAPTPLHVKTGRPVTLVFKNQGVVEHDWAIMEIETKDTPSESKSAGASHTAGGHAGAEPELHVTAPAGESREVTFTPTQPGTFEVVCTVPGHKDAGMVGSLVFGN